MACHPKIDRPCPLSRAAQRNLGNHCAHCDHAVHHLDGMSSAQRRSLVANAGGPLCVSYRLPASAAALALALAMPNAKAADALPTPQAASGPMSPTPTTPSLLQEESPQAPECESDEADELDVILMVGGISAPDDVQWLDEDEGELPEVPFLRDPAG